MPKFTLICEHSDLYGNPNQKMTHEFTAETLDEVLENTELFIKGSGYIPNGVLDFVPLDTDGFPTLYDEMDLPAGKSNHYFDTERNR
jgi:hypothetical protein